MIVPAFFLGLGASLTVVGLFANGPWLGTFIGIGLLAYAIHALTEEREGADRADGA